MRRVPRPALQIPLKSRRQFLSHDQSDRVALLAFSHDDPVVTDSAADGKCLGDLRFLT